MEKREYPRLGETVYQEKLANGLTVLVLPRKGFSRKMAYFVAGTGALKREFVMDGEAYTAPMGVAHYLEHKLFDMPGRDISAEFANLGASVNAFTSYDMTAYYFSCTENFDQCLALLLEMVAKPYFTEESVAKEQGIIGQEIDMNIDAPDSRMFENLAQAMYTLHPIREPILGTRQTIAQITPQVLYDCHRAFYRPENMLLCVIADTDPQMVVDMAQTMTADMPQPEVTMTEHWKESLLCSQKKVTCQMEVSRPIFQLGFKCAPLPEGEAGVYAEYVGEFAAEVLFGESSALYLRMYEEGLIDPSFGGGLDTLQGMAMLSAAGESEDPVKIKDAILAEARKIAKQGISEAEFMRLKRSAMGGKIRSLDSFDSTCFRICSYFFSKFDYLRFPEIFEKVTAQDVQAFIRENITEERCCLSVIEPKEEKDNE